MRPSRDAGTKGDPDPGATGPRLFSKGPPGPRHNTSGRTQMTAVCQRIVGRPTCFRDQRIPEGWPNVAGGRWPPEMSASTSRIPVGCMNVGCGRRPGVGQVAPAGSRSPGTSIRHHEKVLHFADRSLHPNHDGPGDDTVTNIQLMHAGDIRHGQDVLVIQAVAGV